MTTAWLAAQHGPAVQHGPEALAAAHGVPSVFGGSANVVAVVVLLLEFGMFRQALLRDQIRLYAAQSAAVSVLAVIVAAARHVPELYVLAALSAALKVVIVPLVMRRLLRGAGDDSAGSGALSLASVGWGGGVEASGGWGGGVEASGGWGGGVEASRGWGGGAGASTLLLATAAGAFGFFAVGTLGIAGVTLPQAALSLAMAVVLVAFVLMIVRRDVVSQAVGFFSLENGVSLAALVIAAHMPLILEVAFLFDLLVAVIVFGVLIRVHHGLSESLSTAGLTRLRG